MGVLGDAGCAAEIALRLERIAERGGEDTGRQGDNADGDGSREAGDDFP